MNLQQIRHNIDRLDSRILTLLNERMEQVLLTRKLKPKVEDRVREQELLERIRENATGLIDSDFTEKIYRQIIEKSKSLQERDFKLIAFQGEHGAFGEMAARKWNGEMVAVPCNEFADVFDGVQSGVYDYGIVPVENTLGGIVGEVNELLINTELHVVGAVELPVHLCLLALPETEHRDIRSVYSHPQALAQCRRFLARNRLEPVPFFDTAGAARMLAEKRPKASAAVASELSAALYDLEVLKEEIEDLDRNLTRFVVLSKSANTEGGDKCSVVFSTEHKAGTLFGVLETFAKREINLTRIESIPGDPGNYAFFLDFAGSDREERVCAALGEVESITQRFRMMGCYSEKK